MYLHMYLCIMYCAFFILELHETLSVLTSKNKELTNSVSVLSKENDKMKEEHQKDVSFYNRV